MKKPLLAVLAVAVLPILLAACSAFPDAPATEGEAGTAVLRDGTFVVPPELADVVIVDATRLVFPASALATLGDDPQSVGWMANGAALDRDGIVTYALDRLIPASPAAFAEP